MTVFLRALYGPFGRRENAISLNGVVQTTSIDWHFIGILESNETAHWTLRFDVKKRRFICIRTQPDGKPSGLPKLGPVVNPDAFVLDKPMPYGANYTEILRNRLPHAELASATAAALKTLGRS